MSISPEDPRLTDYVLGEMDAGTAEELEAAMAENPATFDEIHEIRGAASALCETVASRPLPSLTDTQRHRLLRLAEAPAPQSSAAISENIIRPAFWGWFGKFATGAAAAAIAVASLIFAYQRGYQNAVVDNKAEQPNKGSVSKNEPLPGETPSIRITVLDPEGDPQPVASRPLSPDSFLPVNEGSEDALVSAVPKVRNVPPTIAESTPDSHVVPGSGSPEIPEIDTPGTSPVPEGVLPIASVDTPNGIENPVHSPIMENPFVEVSTSPRSSFPLRSGADAYAAAAGAIRGTGRFPDPNSIAVEEIVNAFTYSVPGFVPTSSYTHPFAAGAEVFSCPWEPAHRLVRVTLAVPGTTDASAETPKAIAENIELLVEFNRTRAARYRLIGFDGAGLLSAVSPASPKSRALHAGESVTALYEVVPAEGAQSDDLRYTPHNFASPPRNHRNELLCLSISYTRPDVPEAIDSHTGSLVVPVIDPNLAWNRSSSDFQFAAATAAFGMVLSGSEYVSDFGFDQIQTLAERALRDKKDATPRRTDFLDLIRVTSRIARP